MVRRVRSWWAKHPKVAWATVVLAAVAIVGGVYLSSASALATGQLHASGLNGVSGGTWTWTPANSDATALADGSDATFVTLATTTSTTRTLRMNMDNPGAATLDLGTINSVDVYIRASSSLASTTLRGGIRLGATDSLDPALTMTSGTTPALYTFSAIARPGGGNWTWADITNAIGLAQRSGTATTSTLVVYEMYMVVNYTPYTSTITVGNGTNPTGGWVASGASVAVDTFTLQRTAGAENTQLTSTITITDTGTVPANNVTAVDVYEDANTNGVYDAGDLKLNTASGTFSGANAVVTLANPEPVDGTLRTYFVVYTFGALATDGATASARVQAMDTNSSSVVGVPAGVGNTFIVDTGDPSATITSPTNNQQYTVASSATISGTASDTRSGVASVGVSIQRSTDSLYWNDSTGLWGAQVWNAATGTTSWNYSWAFDPAAQNGSPSYTIVARAVDNATRTGTSASVTNVTVSNMSTTVALTNGADPAQAFVVRGQTVSVDAFQLQRTLGTGAATVSAFTIRNAGTSPSANVSAVDIYRDANGNGVYDSGTDTKLNTTSGTFTGTDATVNLPSAETIDGTLRNYFVVYTFAAGAADGATATSLVQAMTTANVDTLTGVPATAGNTFTVDVSSPTATVSAPSTGYQYTSGTSAVISGTAADTASGVGSVAVSIMRANGDYWNGLTNTWVPGPTPIWNLATGTTSWTYTWNFNPTPQAGTPPYTIIAQAADNVSHTGTSPSVTGVTIDTNTTITLGNGTNPSAATVARNQAISVDTFTLQRTLGTKAATVSTVTVRRGGTSAATDVSAVNIYRDFNGNGVYDAGTDTKINTTAGTFAGTDSVVTLTAAEPVDGTLRTYFVVYTFSGTATNGVTATAAVQALGTANVDAFVGVPEAAGSLFTVDAAGPTSVITTPTADGVYFTGVGPVVLTGTASDGTGSGVASVVLRIRRANGDYWNGSAWQPGSADITPTGTTSWTYSWPYVPASQDASPTYTVSAFATDVVGNVGATVQRINIRIDNVKPTLVSASSYDLTHVDLVFSETLATVPAQTAGNYTIAGLTVSAAVLQPDGKTVRLTTAMQTPTYNYNGTISNVTDLAGNVITAATPFTFSVAADTTPPTTPGGATATSGTVAPVVAVVTWTASTDNMGVVGYRIYRSTSASGPFASIGATSGLTFQDTSGVTGQPYYYRVTAFDASDNQSAPTAVLGPVIATWRVTPHSNYADAGNLCSTCHQPHDASTARYIFTYRAASQGELGVCYSCHDGSGASTNVKVGATNSFALASGHALENTTNVSAQDLTNACSSCHTPHRDPGTREALFAGKVNGVTITARDNSWCFACHNSAQAWYTTKYGSAYPALTTPTVDASGYPTFGTFPGPSTYTSSAVNAHVLIPASSNPSTRVAGDCLYCHSSHRGASKYDSLIAAFQAPSSATVASDRTTGAYAALCFACHDGSWVTTGAPNVKQYVVYNGASDAEYSGHRIKSTTPSLPLNAPLPCYECHNPHGSSRNNARLIADTRGASLETSTAAGVRHFCFTCHTSSDAKVWDSASSSYITVPASAKIAGLLRNGGTTEGPGGGKNWLLLKTISGHASADSQSCYICHGNAYGAPDASNNVHNPGPGVSTGGVDCYVCHSTYKIMDAADTSRTTVYHHVMGTSTVTYTGGLAPNAAASSYPTSTANLFCVSCHSDHNYFNAAKGANLRTGILAAGNNTTSTDFIASGSPTYGICISCHGASLAKDTANQHSDGYSTATAKVVGADFAPSAHQYSVASSFGPSPTSVFNANCSKCHNDEQSKQFQDSATQFGTHYSAEGRLLENFGVPITDPLRENDCFGCHSTSSDVTSGTAKPVANRDAYGNAGASMDTTSQMTYKVFHLAVNSAHTSSTVGPDVGYVSCSSCHNPHESSTTTKVADPYNILNGMAFSTIDQKAAFCLKCHHLSASMGGTDYPTYTSNNTTWVPITTTVNGGWKVDKTTYAASGHWSANGSISSSERVACTECHDKHGSKVDNLLGVYDPVDGKMKIRGTEVLTNDKSVCYTCHTNASTGFPNFTRLSNGYPTDGTWPGKTVYDAKMAVHGGCTNLGCHDVHGGPNTYDELTGTYTPANFATCFVCHQAVMGAGYTHVKEFYPVAAGGNNIVSSRAGHSTRSAGNLTVGSALPCYDCHNPHGSGSGMALQVVTQTASNTTVTVGDVSGEITMTTPTGSAAADVRKFCFTCHTTSDSSKGWNGAAMAVVTGTAQVEGISRLDTAAGQLLHLPDVDGHREGDTLSCYDCHGNDYSDAGNNVHNPSGGVSVGAKSCYACHSTYRVMDAADGADRNSYHHVMGTSTVTYNGDIAPGTGTYPTSTSDLYCVSCHTDHNYFNASKGANLRASITSTVTAASDWASTGSNGICISCHTVTRTKDQSNQATDGTTVTQAVTNARYAISGHNYSVDTSFGPTAGDKFSANCSKCHSDEQARKYQAKTSIFTFGTHWSAERSILSTLGATLTDPARAGFCFRCHSRVGDLAGGKPTAGQDYFGSRGSTMTALSEAVWRNFNGSTASSHPVDTTKLACENCHNPHVATEGATKTVDPDNTYNGLPFGTALNTQVTYCLKCHDGTTPSYQANDTTLVPHTVTVSVADGNKTTYAARSHWTVGGSIVASETQSCNVCHDTHGSKAPKLLGVFQVGADQNTITFGATVTTLTANDNSVCFTCHTAKSALYPVPSETASGYQTDGTWPGKATYTTAYNATAKTGSMHTTATAVWPGKSYAGGDCKNCHDVHGTANTYDELRTENVAGVDGVYAFSTNNFSFCFNCHDGAPATALSNIAQFFPTTVGGTATQTSTTRFGHKTLSAGILPAGSALPCYACHNPHGSGSAYGLQINTQTASNTTITVGDASGEITMTPTRSDQDVRNFCFVCHTTSDLVAGSPLGWNGTASAAVTGTAQVEGISRTTYSASGAHLRLPPALGHRAADTQSCYQCHGNGYAAGGNNVHNPTGGVSAGGTGCYTCHTDYKETMDAAGTSKAANYHHVMGTSTVSYTGDLAPNTGTYPTSVTDVYCVSCHSDHNYFNGNKGANLRTDIATAGSNTTNTDFIAGGAPSYGICVTCHATANAKDTTNQKPGTGAAENAAKIVGTDYDASGHDYAVVTTYSASPFKANCSKCHDDENGTIYQDAGRSIGTHYSAEKHLLAAMGVTISASGETDQWLCFKCHTSANAGKDGYGVASLNATAQATLAQFMFVTTGGSSHPVTATAGGSVECQSCHNVHVNSLTSKVASATNTYVAAPYATMTDKDNFCFGCHGSGSLPTTTVTSAVYVPATTFIASGDTADMNKYTYTARAHWTAAGSISSSEVQGCADCHDNHASKAPKLLGAYDVASNRNIITLGATVTTITANDNGVCYACHTSKSALYPIPSENASGYPTDGTWPGKTVYTTSYNPSTKAGSMHTTATVVWPGKSYAGGDCKNCHDVHGTANTYDELRTENAAGTDGVYKFSPANFGFCFNCHDGAPATALSNIAQFYPTETSGTAVQTSTTRYGHKTVSAGLLPAGSALPCYNCHNPHGSGSAYGLQVITQTASNTTITIGDVSGEITMTPTTRTAADIRNFCFTCHTSCNLVSGSYQGWSGTASVGVTGTAQVEGILRTSTTAKLRLPVTSGHYSTDTDSCYKCHGNGYAAGGNNVHNPTGGVSGGGVDCYGCHSTYQTVMEDGLLAKTGATRTTGYHHVMGSATYDGDKAFAAGAYPTSTTDVYCMSCHADHDKFNSSKASNLRSSITLETVLPTDYNYAGTKTYYAASLAQTTGAWTNPANSTGAPDGAVAASPTGAAFEGRHSFPLAALSNITAASVTVRSQADWSGAVNASQILYPTSDVSTGDSWTTILPTTPTTRWDKIDDPVGASDTTTYIQAAGTTQYTAGTANPSVPAGATNILVTVVWLDMDGTSNTGTNWAQLRVSGTVYGTNTTTQLYNPTSTTTYTTYGTTWAENPADGTAWTAASVNTINGFGFDASVAGARITQGYIKITYNANQIIYPTSDVQPGSWATVFPAAPTTQWDKIDDPAPAPANDGAATYIASNGTTAYIAGTAVPTVPTGATDIMATVVYTLTDGTSNTQTNYPQLRVAGTLYGTSQATVGTANPNTAGTYDTYAETFVLNPNGNVAWTPATINTVNGFALTTSGTTAMRLTQMFLVITYQPPAVTVDDTWALQYSVNSGTSWSNITAASTANETALADHTLSLTGILTDSTKDAFLVRAIRNVVGTADANTHLDWDATTLSITTGGGTGVCLGCHAAAITKDTTNQKSFAAPPSTVTPALSVADYGVSAHNFSAASTYGDGTTFSANCSKCHNDEQTKDFQTSTNRFGTHWSAERRILAAMGITVTDPLAEEAECYRCHSLNANGQKTTTNQDWYGVATMSAASQALYGMLGGTTPRAYKHNVGGYIGLHPTSPTDETQAYIASNKHVECADCHDVHAAGTTDHTPGGATGNAIGAGSPLTGVNGVTFAAGTSTNFNLTGSTLATTAAATKEYEICYKCHSSANAQVTGTWSPAAPNSWTDQALEFNPMNKSGHPVVASLNNSPGRTAPVALAVSEMVAPWTNVGNQTMMCSDCHGDSGATPAAQGPHGSTVQWILKGPKTEWTTASTMNNTTNIFCLNCHVLETTMHQTGRHPYPCMYCHIKVPHGGKVSRLIGDGNGTMPARYNGGNMYVNNFIKNTPTGYGEPSCNANAACNYSAHSATTGENW